MKNVLFICPSFFGYYKDIKNKIEEKFLCNVYWFDDRPSQGFFVKAITRLNRKLLLFKNKKYFCKIRDFSIEKEIDTVLIVFGQFLSKEYVRELQMILPNARFVYYVWDSVENYHVIEEIHSLFEKKYSFDPFDCQKYGFKFLPLFYSRSDFDSHSHIEYDTLSIFTIKPGKLKNYDNVKKSLPVNIKNFEYLYLQSRIVYLFYKIFHRAEFKKYRISDFKYKKLSKDDYYNFIKKSRCVIDCQMSNQRGLTMRTFEALGLCKKIITTNCNIKEYDFYNENNIFVCDYDTRIPLLFIENQYDYNYRISSNYSLDKFVDVLLGEE